MSPTHHSQDQGSPAMVSPLRSPPILAPLLTSPILPTSSPEAMFDPEIPPTSQPISTASTPLPASSETSLPSIVNNRNDSSFTSLARRDLRRPSASSIRTHPSILRHNTPPRSPVPNGAVSPTQSTQSAVPASQPQSAHRLSYKTPASPEQQRRNSQDRRVRSEGINLGQGSHRQSFIGTKNPSVLTGGYDSSSGSDSIKEDDRRQQPPTFSTPSASFHGVNPVHLVQQDRRRRAQSLMSPLMDDHSPSGEGSGSGRSSIRTRKTSKDTSSKMETASGAAQAMNRERSGSRSSRLNESVTVAQPPDRRNSLVLPNSSNSAFSPTKPRPHSHSPLASAMQSRSSSTYFREHHAESSRHASFASPRDVSFGYSAAGTPSQHTKDPPARSREVERLRREEGFSTPSESSRKGKEKARDTPEPTGLASSLGLAGSGTGIAGQLVLDTETINNMLADSDAGTALLMLQGNAKSSPGYGSNKDPTRRRSISTQSAEHAMRKELYVPTAPPALIRDDEGHHRDRTISVSSSITPMRSGPSKKSSWDEDADTARRRREARRRSSTLGEGEGGHVPFTHHLPVRVNEAIESSGDESGDNDAQTFEDDRPSSSMTAGDPTHLLPLGEINKGDEGKKKRKGRLSQLFNRRKKSSDSISKEVTKSGGPIKHFPGTPESHDHARSRELYLRDLEIRRLERERRDNEVWDERLHVARQLVNAHPASTRRAERMKSHFRAFYHHVYDSIENPPRLNYLSVLRWKRATAEQSENRAKWKSEQAERQKDPTSFPSTWTQNQVYNSPNSFGSAAHLRQTESRDSQPMSLSTSGTGAHLRSSVSTHATHQETKHHPGSGWGYTVDDIVAYKDADGKVDYFIAPQRPPTILSASMNKSQTSQSNKLDDYRPNESREIDLSSSLGSTSRRMGEPTPRITSASMLSVNAPGTASPHSSHVNLARTASNETSSKVLLSPIRGPMKGLGHRTHQSMSAMHGSTTNLANMVKAPYHKMKARKQFTLPHQSGSLYGSESAIEELPANRHVRPRTSGNTPLNRTPIDPTRSHLTPNRSLRVPGQALTDDEHHIGHDHGRLFLKGRFFHRRRPEEGDTRPQSPETRDEVMHGIRRNLDAEKRFTATQAGGRSTEHAEEDRRRLVACTADMYVERSKTIVAARRRLDALTAELGVADQTMVQFMRDVGQIESISRTSAEIDLNFPDLDGLREQCTGRMQGHGHPHDHSGQTTPTWRSPASSRRGSRRLTNVPSTLPVLLSFGAKPWPRRSILDHEGNRIDPIRQVELALDKARNVEIGMENEKTEALVKIGVMHAKLEEMLEQHAIVLKWLDGSHKAIKRNHDQVINLERELNAGFAWSDLLGPYGDRVADFALRYPFRFMLRAVVRTIKIVGFLPFCWWQAGVFGKIAGAILTVVIVIAGVGWVA